MTTERRKIHSRYTAMERARKQRRSTIISQVTTGVLLAIFAAFFFFSKQNLIAKNKEYENRKEQLEISINEQLSIKQQLEERTKYVQTKKYIEEMAKNKLGLVYPDEIILRPIIEK